MRLLGWVGVAVAGSFAFIMVAGTVIGRENDLKKEENRKLCANEIYWAAKYSKTPDELDALVRSRPYAQKVCADFQINGVDVIPRRQ